MREVHGYSRPAEAVRRGVLAAVAVVMLGVTLPQTVAAATFEVAAGDVSGLIQAIEMANATPEADTINLAGGTYTLTAVHSIGSGLPPIAGTLTIDGHHAVIERSAVAGTPLFRLIFVNGTNANLTLNDVTIRNGKVDVNDGGGGIANFAGTLTLNGTTVSGNSAQFGGGIGSNGTVTLNRSVVTGNSVSGLNASGGGIYNNGRLVVSQSTIASNSSAAGGGIYNGVDMTVIDSTVSNNTSDGSAGILNEGTARVVNSTISGNRAVFNGGGIFLMQEGTLALINSTVTANSADGAGGGVVALGALTASNSIIGGNLAGGNCSGGSIVALGSNLSTDGTCPGFTSVSAAALNLGPLVNNGGPTRTHALLAGSVAIDAGDQAECLANEVTTDQRGFLRDSHCDIGAFEFGAGLRADLIISQSVDKIAVKQGDLLTYLITVQNIGPDAAPNVVVNDVMSSGTTFVSVRTNKGTVTAPPAGNTGTVTWYIGDMLKADSQTAQLTVTVLVKGKTTISNTASVTGDVVDPNSANNSATITVSVAAGSSGGRNR